MASLLIPEDKPIHREELSDTHNECRFVTDSKPRDIDIDPHDNLLLAVPKRARPGR